ncbi:hypothetical protein HMSSN139_63950 [Paenibacillus sp. HMSSN-139]|nr:hypothetical protein HMSSN139_63950 [Paenibacillus sp. HMSSN-139]
MKLSEFVKEFEEILTVELGTITLETKLSDIDEWDSLTKIALDVFLEDVFKIKVEQKEIEDFETFADIVDVVKRSVRK